MLSSFWDDPFFSDSLYPSSNSSFFFHPHPLRLTTGVGPSSNMNMNMNTPTDNTQLMRRNNQDTSLANIDRNLNNQWLSWNNLFSDPLQLSLNDNGSNYEIISRKPAGLRPKDLKLEVHDNVLTIRGEREKHRKNKSGTSETDEWVSFSRSLVLPSDIDLQKIQAKYDENQELHIELPKKEGAGPRNINIQGQNNLTTGNEQKQQQQVQGEKLSQEKSDKMQIDKESPSLAQGNNKNKSKEPRSQTQTVPISKS